MWVVSAMRFNRHIAKCRGSRDSGRSWFGLASSCQPWSRPSTFCCAYGTAHWRANVAKRLRRLPCRKFFSLGQLAECVFFMSLRSSAPLGLAMACVRTSTGASLSNDNLRASPGTPRKACKHGHGGQLNFNFAMWAIGFPLQSSLPVFLSIFLVPRQGFLDSHPA